MSFSTVEFHQAVTEQVKKNVSSCSTPALSIKLLRKYMHTTDNYSAIQDLLSGKSAKAKISVGPTSCTTNVTILKKFGAFYAYTGSNFEFVFLVTEDMDLLSLSQASKSELNKVTFSAEDLVNSPEVSKVFIPLVPRGVQLTTLQKAFLNSSGVKVAFDFEDALRKQPTLFEFDGVFFLREQFGRFKSYRPSKKSKSKENDRKIPSVFISEELPLNAQLQALSSAYVDSVTPTFRNSKWRHKIIVPESATSSNAARKEYTSTFCKLDGRSLPDNMHQVFRVVSFCAESIENSSVWDDSEMSLLAPKLDSFKEAGEILSSLSSLWELYSNLCNLEDSISADQFVDRMNVIHSSVHALRVRTCSFIDYAAELHRLSGLVQEKNQLSRALAEEMANMDKLAAWDAAASQVVVQTIENHAAAEVNAHMAKIIEDLSYDIDGRIAYLTQVKNHHSLSVA